MCPDGFLFHPTDPTSYLILSSHLLAETMELSHVPVAFFSLPVMSCCLSRDVVVFGFGLHISFSKPRPLC